MMKELKKGRMVVIDVFGFRYLLVYVEFFGVFYLDSVELEIINLKIDVIYLKFVEEKGLRLFRMIYIFDGVVVMFDEGRIIKLLNQIIVEKSVIIFEFVLLIVLNLDVVSRSFLVWIVSFSDYVIFVFFKVMEEGIREFFYMVKFVNIDFELGVYFLEIRKGEERIYFEKFLIFEFWFFVEEQWQGFWFVWEFFCLFFYFFDQVFELYFDLFFVVFFFDGDGVLFFFVFFNDDDVWNLFFFCFFYFFVEFVVCVVYVNFYFGVFEFICYVEGVVYYFVVDWDNVNLYWVELEWVYWFDVFFLEFGLFFEDSVYDFFDCFVR